MLHNMMYLTEREKVQLAHCGGKCGGCIHSTDCDLSERLDEPDKDFYDEE